MVESQSRIGIELDGNHATIVEVTGHSAVKTYFAVGSTPTEALLKGLEAAGVKPSKKANPIRVSLVSSNVAVRVVDLTAKALQSRSAFEDAVYEKMPDKRGVTTAAGLFFNKDELTGDTLGSGLSAVVSAEAVEDVYRALSAYPKVEVVPPAFTLANYDGLHLAIRNSNADLTLVVNNKPVLYRSLKISGLNTIIESLGNDESAIQRVEAIINHSNSPDPIAEGEIASYLKNLADEVNKTLNAWERRGEELPTGIQVFGSGARIRDIIDYFEDADLKIITNETLIRQMSYIPLGNREAATGAFLAGLTYGVGAPASAYPSVVAKENMIAARKRKNVINRVVAVVAVIAIPVAAYFGPVAAGRLEISNANDEKASAQERFDSNSEAISSLGDVISLEDSYQLIASNDPLWKEVLTQTFSTAETAEATIDSISAEYLEDQLVVSASASAYDPAATYAPLTRWLNTLQDPEGPIQAVSVTTSGFSYTQETQISSFQVRFVVPSDLILEDRLLGEQE